MSNGYSPDGLQLDGYGWSSDLSRFTDDRGYVWSAEIAIAKGIAGPLPSRTGGDAGRLPSVPSGEGGDSGVS